MKRQGKHLRRLLVQAGRVLRALWRVAIGRAAVVLIDDRGAQRAYVDLRRRRRRY